MSITRLSVLSAFAFQICVATAANAEPVAIVEDAAPTVPGVQPMDLLEPGQKITLPDGANLILGFLRSCIRERISGGEVTIGPKRSVVVNGSRKEESVDCNGAPRIVTGKRGAETAGAVFRKGSSPKKTYPKPDWTLYGTTPVLVFSRPAKHIRIERLDRNGEKAVEMDVTSPSIDTAKAGLSLDPGGLYALTNGPKRYILKVSPLAAPDAPLLSRLVPM